MAKPKPTPQKRKVKRKLPDSFKENSEAMKKAAEARRKLAKDPVKKPSTTRRKSNGKR